MVEEPNKAYRELTEMILQSDEPISADLNEIFMIFIRKLKRRFDFQAAALFYYEEEFSEIEGRPVFTVRSHLGFQAFLERADFYSLMEDLYKWVMKRKDPICLPSDLQPGANDLLIPLVQFQHKMGLLHLVTDLDPLHISQHQQVLLNYFSHQISRSLLYAKRLEQHEQSLQDEKIHSMGLMLSGILHEMNSPLTAIHGYTELLKNEIHDHPQASLEERLPEYVSVLEKETRRVLNIVKSMLKFVRKQPISFEHIDMHAFLASVLSLLDYELKQEHIQVHLALDALDYTIWGEPTQIQQVFFNLFTNASHVLQQLPLGQSRELWIRSHSHKGMLTLELTDNGGGIPANHLNRIFEPFFTTKKQNQGTGLGLSVSYKIIGEHGGQIRVRNVVQPSGACFEVILPLADAGERKVEYLHRTLDAVSRPAQILVIDNEPSILQYIDTLLRRAGHKPILTKTGQEALAWLEFHEPDLVISDLMLDDMSGFALYEKIIQSQPEQTVFFLTGAVLSQELQHFLQIHRLQCLYKPFYAQELIDMVGRVLQAKKEDPNAFFP